jgi:osmotically-inducible protein OsmY
MNIEYQFADFCREGVGGRQLRIMAEPNYRFHRRDAVVEPEYGSSVLKRGANMKAIVSALVVAITFMLAVGCNANRPNDTSYKDRVKTALEQADLKDVTVDEDRDKNTITLGGTLHSNDAKTRAGEVAKSAAPNRTVANEISVQPVGVESEAKDIASNLDDGIEKNYKAALISSGLDKQHIRFDAKNGVLTLKGTVQTEKDRQDAERVATAISRVQQVVNNVEVRR